MDFVELKELEDGLFEVSYLANGKMIVTQELKRKDVVKILIYNRDKDAFILTRQFRPFLYVNYPEMANRVELCGGGVDDGYNDEQAAIKEVLEETGYKVEKLQKITTLYTVSKMTLYYTEVDDSMRVNSGGGVDEDEDIEVIELPISKAKEFMFDESKPKRPALMFTFCWYFNMRSEFN